MRDPSDNLLERLTKGEIEAAAEVYATFELVLRVMVRRRLTPRLRAKFDSTDVVQSAWADLLKGFRAGGWQFSDREHLRAYLAKVTCNHLVNFCRRHSLSMGHEQPLAGDEQFGLPPSASPLRQRAGAGRRALGAACGSLSPGPSLPARAQAPGLHHLAEIATRTGLHESSVRRILYDLGRRLAAVRDETFSASPS